MDTDLQLGYEIYDRSYEINSVIQAIAMTGTRSFIIQNDDATKFAVNGLNAIANQLKGSPVVWFNEISNAASSRSNSEIWHLQRIRNAFINHNTTLNVLLNATGPLSNFDQVANPNLIFIIYSALARIQEESSKVLSLVGHISRDVSYVKNDSSLLLTPEMLSESLNANVSKSLTTSLIGIRNSFVVILAAVGDIGRLVVAHGSAHDFLTRSYSRDILSNSNALNKFVTNYNRVRNNLMSAVESYRRSAIYGIENFISRVQSTYVESIVRPRFENEQLPLIQSFAKTIIEEVYNQTMFEESFDNMRDLIANGYTFSANGTISRLLEYRQTVLDLQRFSFVRSYSQCLNELVTEAQAASTLITNKYVFCLDERTSGIAVVIPSTNNGLGAIRDTINNILESLNGCLSGQTSAAGRTDVSDCIQAVS